MNSRPEKTDFVRMAGMFDAIIIPFSSVGIAESVNIFFDKDGMNVSVICSDSGTMTKELILSYNYSRFG
jgi:hypothetical protein